MSQIKSILSVSKILRTKHPAVAGVLLAVLAVGIMGVVGFAARPAYAAIKVDNPSTDKLYTCGGTVNGVNESVKVSFNIGCAGKGYALVDELFAILRFLSAGVGIAIVGSLVWAGIQYTSSRGDPALAANAMRRITSTLIALLVYIFAAALLNFVIPKGFLDL